MAEYLRVKVLHPSTKSQRMSQSKITKLNNTEVWKPLRCRNISPSANSRNS